MVCNATNLTYNLTIYNMILWFAGLLRQMTHWPSVWCSKYDFFYNFLQNHQQTSKPAYHILVCQIYIHEFVLSSHGYFALAIAEKRETFWFNVDLSCKNLLEVQSSKKGSGWQESQTSKRKSGFRTWFYHLSYEMIFTRLSQQ